MQNSKRQLEEAMIGPRLRDATAEGSETGSWPSSVQIRGMGEQLSSPDPGAVTQILHQPTTRPTRQSRNHGRASRCVPYVSHAGDGPETQRVLLLADAGGGGWRTRWRRRRGSFVVAEPGSSRPPRLRLSLSRCLYLLELQRTARHSPPRLRRPALALRSSSLLKSSWSRPAADMSLLRTRLVTTPRAHLQTAYHIAARPQQRFLSSTSARSAGDHAHEDHYDPPGGWLFGVKPGEKYENEGWENLWVYGFFGSLLLGVVGYCYKPDTSIQTWALEEARRRLEAEGILEDPEQKK